MLIALPNQPAAGGSAYNSLYGEALTERRTFLRLLACSAGVFFQRAIRSRKRHVETPRGEEEIGRVKGSGGGGEGGGIFFSPPPPPFPSFALAPTVRLTISTLPNLPLS